MSVVGVTAARTVARARNFASTGFVAFCFLAAVGALFAFNLAGAEGRTASLSVLWATSVAPALPVVSALVAMGMWSDERQSGRIHFLLSAPVSEGDLVLGKFLGAWAIVLALVALSAVLSLALVRCFAPSALSCASCPGFALGFAALAMQGALWCAVAVTASALFRSSASAACATVLALFALPRGIWAACMEWSRQGRVSFGEMPLDAHVVDVASGVVSSGTVCFYLLLTLLSLFICTGIVASFRMVGRGARSSRLSGGVSVCLATMLVGLLVTLAVRLDVTVELPVGATKCSARTRAILSDLHGDVSMTCFLARGDSRFREVSHCLRTLANVASSQGDCRVSLRFVDPRWDVGAAERLVRDGVKESTVVLRRARRRIVVAIDEGFGERTLASALMRLSAAPQRNCVYWTVGHGESAFDAYDAFGMSDMARELMRGGYVNRRMDFASDEQVPPDCALVVVAGARTEFSRVEVDRLEAYLKQGGRLLLLAATAEGGSAATMLSNWGLRIAMEPIVGERTLSGSDVVVSDFGPHPVTETMGGARIVLESPLSFFPSAVAGTGVGADKVDFMPLASVGGHCVAALVERGVAVGGDLALRPTRIVAIGDALFVMNGQLALRANANRDFFMRCVMYLSGSDVIKGGVAEDGALVSGMDRDARMWFAAWAVGIAPCAIFAVFLICLAYRRRKL